MTFRTGRGRAASVGHVGVAHGGHAIAVDIAELP